MRQPRFSLPVLQIGPAWTALANRRLLPLLLSVVSATLFYATAYAQGPTPGQNVNMVSGTKWPGGDPFLRQQNEPSIAVSTRNPQHLLAGANDYRTVDLNLVDQLPINQLDGDAWLGVFKSFDGGQRWQSTLLPGFPQDGSTFGAASPMKGFAAGSDAVVRAGTNGMFYYSGIALNRTNNLGGVFLARFIDLNNKENGDATQSCTPGQPCIPAPTTDPIRYLSTVKIDGGTAGQFIDKPWIAVDMPRAGTGTCSMQVPQDNGIPVSQSFPAGNVYIAYAMFVGGQINVRSKINFSKSSDCGATWTKPIMISQTYDINQGTQVAVDPETGYVYVAWRIFSSGNDPNAIVVAKSTDGGNTFSKAVPVRSLPSYNGAIPPTSAVFDQNTSGTEFRSQTMPTLAVGDSGQPLVPGTVYAAWSERGAGPGGDARIMISTSSDGINWLTPMTVDNGPLSDDHGNQFSHGQQLMPAMTFIGGKLLIVYYDLRLDATTGVFTPTPSFMPDAHGNFFEEARQYVGDLLAKVFTPFVDDAGLVVRRHTMDVVVAQLNPGLPLTFTTARLSRYDFGLPGSDDVTGGLQTGQLEQLNVNPPNLPMFAKGTVPFMGDYMDVAGQMFVPLPPVSGQPQGWTFNNPGLLVPASSPVYFGSWTSNQDVIPPKATIPGTSIADWTQYTAPSQGPSVFNGTQLPQCIDGNEGDRNQNIYESRITQGLYVSSPQNSKLLSTTLQRAFVILVQNSTNFQRGFQLSIANQPQLANGSADPSGFASFTAGTNNPGPIPPAGPPTPPSPVTTRVHVTIAAHSGATRTVFALSSNFAASIPINVNEIKIDMNGNPIDVNGNPILDGNGNAVLVPGGLSSFIVLNADGTVPALVDPDGAPTNTTITGVEIYTPGITRPTITDPGITRPGVTTPGITRPGITRQTITSPGITRPGVPNQGVMSASAANTSLADSSISASNPNSLADATYTLTNNGNTSAAYTVNLTGTNVSVPLQLAVTQVYTTQSALNCALVPQQQDITNTNVVNPGITRPGITRPGITRPNPTDATILLAPGDSAFITLRGQTDPITMATIVTQIAPVVTAQAANTNDPTNTPPFVAPLFITTATLPGGVATTPYSASVQAIGGTPPYTAWNVVFGSGSLPGGLSLALDSVTGNGVISGTPTAAGTFTFTVQVVDSSVPQQITTRSLTINVLPPPLVIATTSLPTGVTGFEYAATVQATGGTPPYSWSSSTLPSNLVINPSTGQISGAPTAVGTTLVTIQVTDSSSPPQQVSSGLSLTVTSPVASNGGDFIFRGFYLPNYTGTGLAQATLNFSAAVAGDYTITLTAHSTAYNGPVIGISTTTVSLPGTVTTSVPTIFNFPSPATRIVPGSLVAFTMTLVSGPSQPYFAVSTCGLGDSTCTTGGPFVETEDTTAPLSVFRRNGVVVNLVSVPSPSISGIATGVSTPPRSGGEALAADLTTSNLFIKSLQDPVGSDLQFAQVAHDRTVTILGDFPSMTNSDGSGIAVHPFGGLIVADEAGNRIVGIGLPTATSGLTNGTLFNVPWPMNPLGNGTGQQQYAPVLTQSGTGPTHLLLYFWDSTQSGLFDVEATAPTTVVTLLSLDQSTAAGRHFTTAGNHIVYDFNTATLLLTDGSTNTVAEVNPANSPVTVTTLFSGLPGTPTSIALNPISNQVFVQIGNSIYVGPRSGGSLSLFATGFSSLTNIVIGNATLTSGSSLFAVDRQLNTVYEMPLEITISSVNLSSTTLNIDGSSVPYTAILSNGTGTTVSSVVVQAYIDQGTASRAAGGSLVTCAQTLGDLPPGSCNFNLTVSASNSTAGTGTLVPGIATARFELRSPSTLFSVFTVAVNLQ